MRVDVRFVHAPSFQRWVARLLDAVFGFVCAFMFMPFLMPNDPAFVRQHHLQFHFIAVVFIFWIFFSSLLAVLLINNTIGKHALGLEVHFVAFRGSGRVSRSTLLVREVVYAILSAIPLLNLLSMILGVCCGGDFLHDQAMGTTVVIGKKQ
ncbi:MAG: RDD family protein [Nitrosomonas sp.]|nr:RDD family protein [Nitrosomonas sp.]